MQDNQEYRRRINAWCMYDWANSAFATTILAAVLPVYYSQVAGANLPSESVATTYWSLGLSVSLLIVAVLSPIMGTVSDVMRRKKRYLSIFASMGILGTGLLVFVSTGDWLLASVLFIMGRIGFTGANVFYDALLPHVAKANDRDRVSTRGYAMGYLGGGILLAINIVMISLLPGTWGPRLSFLSVAIWWAVFSIPILRQVPEPMAAMGKLAAGRNVLTESFLRMRDTFRDIKRYRQLFKYLVAFLIYNDGIGTIIGVAAIYGAELGFGSVELILALLLVQFVGIPFSLMFGRLPSKNENRRPVFFALIVFNLVVMPVVGLVGARILPPAVSGAPLPPYETTASNAGEGYYTVDGDEIHFEGVEWKREAIAAEMVKADKDVAYAVSDELGGGVEFPFYGQQVRLTYRTGPDQGIFAVEIDGQPLLDEDSGAPLEVDAYNPTERYGVRETFKALEPGSHTLRLSITGRQNEQSKGTFLSLTQLEVLSPIRQSNLFLILGGIVAIEIVGMAFAFSVGKLIFGKLVSNLDAKRSVILALVVYSVIAVWGYFLDSVVEFWLLAWMVAMVQGGSQALSRSLYASMSPAAKSGEFFGLYGVMEKFSAIIGPLIFAAAGTIFGSSRPAVLSLILLFIIGVILLLRVDVDEGNRVAQLEDAELLGIVGKT